MTDPRVAVIVPSQTPALVDIFLRASDLFTPENARTFVVCLGDWDTPKDAGNVQERWLGKAAFLHPVGAGETYSTWNHWAAGKAMADGADILVFANDDTVVTPDWLPTMLEDLAALKRGGLRPGLLGACSNVCAPGPQLSAGGGGIHHNGLLYGRDPSGVIQCERFAGPVPFDRIVTQFAMVEARAYRESGGFDVDLPSHAWADFVLSYRMLRAGFANAASRAFVCHFGSRTLTKQDHAGDYARGREYVRAKYPGLEKALGLPEAE